MFTRLKGSFTLLFTLVILLQVLVNDDFQLGGNVTHELIIFSSSYKRTEIITTTAPPR